MSRSSSSAASSSEPSCAPLDPLERAERGLDGRPLPPAGEVGAEPRAQVARLADVEHRVVAVAEEVDARGRRGSGDERALRVEPARARRGELDEIGDASAHRAPARGRGARSGSRRSRPHRAALGGTGWSTCRRSARARASEKRSLRRWSSRRASQTVSTTGAATRRPVSRSTSRSRKREVEARVVGDERRVAGEARKRRTASSGARRAAQVARRGSRSAPRSRAGGQTRVDERLEGVVDLERAHPRRADLARSDSGGRETGRLEVEDDELGVLDQRVGVRRGRRARRARRATRAARHPRRRRRAASGRAPRARARARRATRAASSAATGPAAPGRARRAGRRRRTRAASAEAIEHMFVSQASQ